MTEPFVALEDVIAIRKTGSSGPFGLWGRRPVRALDRVSLSVARGECLGIIGGSGGGKTTLAEAITLRLPVDRGRITVEGKDVARLSGDERKKLRRRLQLIRQDARASLDLGVTVRRQLEEAMYQAGFPGEEKRIIAALQQVELPATFLDRIPFEMSGGEQRRVAIAKSLTMNPLLVAADEPVGGVDPRLADELLRLLKRVQRQANLALVVVSHDMDVIRSLADRVAVLHAGRLYELGPVAQVLSGGLHPYTRQFLSVKGEPMPPEEDLAGKELMPCPWVAHCGQATERCRREVPLMREVADTHRAACHALPGR